jgi:hypothetical protein
MTRPLFWARLAGAVYLLSVATAVFAEFFAPGKLGLIAIVVPVAGYVVVTFLLYAIFRPVNQSVALLALVFSLVSLCFEALLLQPRGINAAMILHGVFCLLIAALILASNFMPRVLGALMALAGVVWLIYMSPHMAQRLSPYNSAVGILGEGLPMLWLLVMGVNAQRWKEQEQRSRLGCAVGRTP